MREQMRIAAKLADELDESWRFNSVTIQKDRLSIGVRGNGKDLFFTVTDKSVFIANCATFKTQSIVDADAVGVIRDYLSSLTE